MQSRGLVDGAGQGNPLNRFKLLKEIGKGTFGSIYAASDLEDKKLDHNGIELPKYAIKVLPLEEGNRAFYRKLETEISIMKIGCQSEHVIRYFDHYIVTQKQGNKQVWIVMEFCDNGSLGSYMNVSNIVDCKPFAEKHIAVILKQVLQSLEFLHKEQIIHRDIKSANVLWNSDGTTRLADLGESIQLSREQPFAIDSVGSPYWMSPELARGDPYNTSVDIWSLGVTAIELAEVHPPLFPMNPIRAMYLLGNMNSPPDWVKQKQNYSQQFADFVTKCLHHDPRQRHSASQLLQHPFIATADDESFVQLAREYHKPWQPPEPILYEEEVVDASEELKRTVKNGMRMKVQLVAFKDEKSGETLPQFIRNLREWKDQNIKMIGDLCNEATTRLTRQRTGSILETILRRDFGKKLQRMEILVHLAYKASSNQFGVIVMNRWVKDVFYENCFIGKQLVDWIYITLKFSQRADAIQLGVLLVFNDLITGLTTKDHLDIDSETSVYRFSYDKIKKLWGGESSSFPEPSTSKFPPQVSQPQEGKPATTENKLSQSANTNNNNNKERPPLQRANSLTAFLKKTTTTIGSWLSPSKNETREGHDSSGKSTRKMATSAPPSTYSKKSKSKYGISKSLRTKRSHGEDHRTSKDTLQTIQEEDDNLKSQDNYPETQFDMHTSSDSSGPSTPRSGTPFAVPPELLSSSSSSPEDEDTSSRTRAASTPARTGTPFAVPRDLLDNSPPSGGSTGTPFAVPADLLTPSPPSTPPSLPPTPPSSPFTVTAGSKSSTGTPFAVPPELILSTTPENQPSGKTRLTTSTSAEAAFHRQNSTSSTDSSPKGRTSKEFQTPGGKRRQSVGSSKDLTKLMVAKDAISEAEVEKKLLEQLTNFRSDLTERDNSLIFTSQNLKQFKKNEIIVEEGKPNRSVWKIKSGTVRVEKKDENGNVTVLAIMNPGQLFGEMSVLTKKLQGNASATIRADSPVAEIYRADVAFMYRLFKTEPAMHQRFFKKTALQLARKLRAFDTAKPPQKSERVKSKEEDEELKKQAEAERQRAEAERQQADEEDNREQDRAQAQAFWDIFDLPKEFVIQEYHCYIQGLIKEHGKLYITQNFVCFYAQVFGLTTKIVCMISHIISLQLRGKRELKIKTRKKRIHLRGLTNPDDTHSLILSLMEAPQQKDVQNPISPSTSKFQKVFGGFGGGMNRKSSEEILGEGGMNKQQSQEVLDARGAPDDVLTSDDWIVILQGAQEKSYKKDELIVDEGQWATRIHQIAEGKCRVEKVIASSTDKPQDQQPQDQQPQDQQPQDQQQLQEQPQDQQTPLKAGKEEATVNNFNKEPEQPPATTDNGSTPEQEASKKPPKTVIGRLHAGGSSLIKEKLSWTLSKGEIFGEISFLEGGKTSASIFADEDDTTVYVIEGASLAVLFMRQPALAGRFFQYLSIILANRLKVRERELYR